MWVFHSFPFLILGVETMDENRLLYHQRYQSLKGKNNKLTLYLLKFLFEPILVQIVAPAAGIEWNYKWEETT